MPSPRPPGPILLRTKLGPPPARAGLIRRSRLDAQLEAGAKGRLCLVDAPAGSGKTTLLAQWWRAGDVSESSVVSIKNKWHAVTAEVVVPDSGAERVVVAQGGSIGGWSLYAKDGKPRYCYNLLGVQRFYVQGDQAVVSEDYGPRGNQFTGEVRWVQIDLGDDAADADHFLTAEERLKIAMARQ